MNTADVWARALPLCPLLNLLVSPFPDDLDQSDSRTKVANRLEKMHLLQLSLLGVKVDAQGKETQEATVTWASTEQPQNEKNRAIWHV